jgi:hypothetical protein
MEKQGKRKRIIRKYEKVIPIPKQKLTTKTNEKI